VSPPRTRVQPLCPVRGCRLPLELAERAWECPRRHGFDVARSGYVNLLQPGDRRSRTPGDSPEAVAARARLEERGFATAGHATLVQGLAPLFEREGEPALDVGAGTGSLLGRLVAAHGLDGWALDLSAAAVRQGARRWPGLAWIVANGHRELPFADGTFRLVLSSVGPKNPHEFRRVLAPDGWLVLLVPGPDDLIELREVITGEGRRRDRSAAALEAFEPAFECVERTLATETHWLERPELDDLLAATYRGARFAENRRLAALAGLETTFSSHVLRFRPRADGP